MKSQIAAAMDVLWAKERVTKFAARKNSDAAPSLSLAFRIIRRFEFKENLNIDSGQLMVALIKAMPAGGRRLQFEGSLERRPLVGHRAEDGQLRAAEKGATGILILSRKGTVPAPISFSLGIIRIECKPRCELTTLTITSPNMKLQEGKADTYGAVDHMHLEASLAKGVRRVGVRGAEAESLREPGLAVTLRGEGVSNFPETLDVEFMHATCCVTRRHVLRDKRD
ncbi:hypothetical protein BV25DRAFT_1950354 [Artomyces pyxidatus]|uniref:Uncharacterized protein n=1 Tax=Artomyces pyxidatus TaxID=48021 RepID=A0ACB8SX76_9AGAM|nr:hypothetical protein BV25DRAFT_1950354 [Artomyces pyxidatus]